MNIWLCNNSSEAEQIANCFYFDNFTFRLPLGKNTCILQSIIMASKKGLEAEKRVDISIGICSEMYVQINHKVLIRNKHFGMTFLVSRLEYYW